MKDPSIRELIDACRPTGDEERLSEFAPLAEALRDPAVRQQLAESRAWDQQVTGAMADVPVPPQLAERLLAALESEAAGAELSPARLAADDEQVSLAGGQPEFTGRRRWLRRALLAMSAVVVFGAAGLAVWFARPSTMPEAVAIQWADKFVDAALKQGAWNRNLAAAPTDYPVSSAVRTRPVAWTSVRLSGQGKALVYDMTPPGGQHVLLVVMRPDASVAAPLMPPSQPQFSTGGWSIGLWQQQGGLVQALAVEGGPGRYQSLVKNVSDLAMLDR